MRRVMLLLALLAASFMPASGQRVGRSFSPGAAFDPPDTQYLTLAQGFNVADAQYFDIINAQFQFTPEEMALLERNGFLITDRLAFPQFKRAYAYLYWKDLPVLVTTDSILHAIHQSYDQMLMEMEETVLMPLLQEMLWETREQVRVAAQANTDSRLASSYADLDAYLTAPLLLLSDYTEGAYTETARQASGIVEVELFGGKRPIDFTQFKPRGHYAENWLLAHYFQAVMWLEQIDFRLVEYDPYGSPQVNVGHIVAANLLRDALDAAGQRTNWTAFDALMTAFVGPSDNVTLEGLDRFIADAGVSAPGDFLDADPARLLDLLTSGDYGVQNITGQVLAVYIDNPDALPRPVSFMLMGQRFTPESYIMSNLVFDRLIVNGDKVLRPYPSPLDVMAVMGNERAVAHLEDELTRYGYQDALTALRAEIYDYSPEFWGGSLYNLWLSAIRTLNVQTTDEAYPQAMRTAAWADKALHTQLASWAQLRHDNILYAKHSFTIGVLCSYPAGYVEPYPAFYAAVADYARFGQAQFDKLDTSRLTQEGLTFYQTALAYFDTLEQIALQLETLAQKELRLEPFTPEEEIFVKSVVIRQSIKLSNVCGEPPIEEWDGWYTDLLPWDDDSSILVADVHTNLNNDPQIPALLPPGVLHVATGDPVLAAMIVNTDEGQTMYVGPAFTYYEVLKEGSPPVRLDDMEWENLLRSEHPAPPGWTSSFRLSKTEVPEYLILPGPNE